MLYTYIPKMLRCSNIKLLLLLVAASNAALLPDYYKKCSLSDPKLNTCLTRNAIEAWPSIIRGDKNVHLQELDPISVPFLHAEIGDQFIANMSNSLLTGFADAKINEIKLDTDKNVLDIHFLVPRFNIWGEYDIKGTLINLPLEGQGIANGSLYNMDNHLRIEYELKEIRDKHYIKPVKNFMSHNITFLDIYMDNLGETVNSILNENWKLFHKEISEQFDNVYGEIFTEILKPFFRKVSFEELFSE